MKKILVVFGLLAASLSVCATPAFIDVKNVFATVGQQQDGKYECPWTFESGQLKTNGVCSISKYGSETSYGGCGLYGKYRTDEQIIEGITSGKCTFTPAEVIE